MDIKILSMNIHKGHGWTRRKKTLSLLDVQINTLAPDLIFFQEILNVDAEQLIVKVWPHYSYGNNTAHLKNHYGNAILSKFPIVFSKNFDISDHRFEHRGFLYCQVMLPNQTILHLICAHLGLFKKSRTTQVKKIGHHIESYIPKNEAVILAGDFNDWAGNTAHYFLEHLKFEEAFLKHEGAYARTFPAWKPLLTLDRIYYRHLQVRYAEKMINDKWSILSDHIGLYTILQLQMT